MNDPVVMTLALAWAAAATVVALFCGRRPDPARSATKTVLPRKLGPWVLAEVIGKGGMGSVYRAEHALLHRPAALKLVRGEATADTKARLQREAELTSRLTHENTVRVYDSGSADDGTLYFAMEHIDGITLWELVARDGPQHPGRVVTILRQVCASLAEAHALGLIHRDVKPENVLVCEHGPMADHVKVVDFGLARPVDDARGESETAVVGTPQYMAPEAVMTPRQIDARADLYSVGALAYFLLTGTDVFRGASTAILSQQVNAAPEPPSARVGRELPPDLEALVMRCLAKDPKDRPPSALGLAAALEATSAAPMWTSNDSADWWRSFGSRPVAESGIRLRVAQTMRSKRPAAPMPPPMHIETTPYLPLRRASS